MVLRVPAARTVVEHMGRNNDLRVEESVDRVTCAIHGNIKPRLDRSFRIRRCQQRHTVRGNHHVKSVPDDVVPKRRSSYKYAGSSNRFSGINAGLFRRQLMSFEVAADPISTASKPFCGSGARSRNEVLLHREHMSVIQNSPSA